MTPFEMIVSHLSTAMCAWFLASLYLKHSHSKHIAIYSNALESKRVENNELHCMIEELRVMRLFVDGPTTISAGRIVIDSPNGQGLGTSITVDGKKLDNVISLAVPEFNVDGTVKVAVTLKTSPETVTVINAPTI